MAGCVSEEHRVTPSACGSRREEHSLCRDPAGWTWEFGAGTKLRGCECQVTEQVRDRGALRSLRLSGRCRGGREVLESHPAGSEALLWECFPSAMSIPISVPQTLRLGGSGRCEVLSLGGVRANSCKILCTKNSSTLGQFKAAQGVWGPDSGLV